MIKKNVLIVDDNKGFLSELEEMLALSGYSSITVENSSETRKAVEAVDIDVILLDLQMPGKNGFELAYELHNLPRFRDVPIIAMTGFFGDNYRFLFKTCGITDCLRKPFAPLDVISSIENALSEKLVGAANNGDRLASLNSMEYGGDF